MKTNTEKVVHGISVQTIVTFVLGVIEMGYFAIMSRLLTKSDFGYYAALTGIMSIFMSISEAGLGASIIQKKKSSEEFVSSVFTLSLLIGAVISVFIFIAAPFLAHLVADDTLTTPLRVMTITVIPYCLTSVGNATLYKKLDFKRVGINSVITYFLSSVVAIICACVGMGLGAVLTYSVLVPLINFLLLYFLYVKVPKLALYKQHIKDIFSFSGWLTLSTIVNNVTHQIDKLVLPKLMSVVDLGAYNRPAGFITTISSKINGIFDTVLFPMLSGIQDDQSKLKSVLHRSVSLLNSLSVLFAVILFANADTIILIFFGKEWMDLVLVLQVLSISLAFNIDNRLVDCFFRSLAFVKQSFYLRTLGFVITLGSIILTSKYGLPYVALGVVVSNVIIIFLKMFYLCRRISVPIGKLLLTWFSSWRSVLPLLMLWIINIILPWSSIVKTIIFIILQCVILFFQFIIFPSLVGKEYKQAIHPILVKQIKRS